LFTLYIHDNFGYWNIEAYFFISNKDSNTVAKALKIICQFECNWKSHYFLTDQSNVEANSIAITFLDLQKGEQECDVIFCTIYVV